MRVYAWVHPKKSLSIGSLPFEFLPHKISISYRRLSCGKDVDRGVAEGIILKIGRHGVPFSDQPEGPEP